MGPCLVFSFPFFLYCFAHFGDELINTTRDVGEYQAFQVISVNFREQE